MEKKILGILGGVGPLATMTIGEMIVRRTKARTDQEHIHTIITSNPSIPDRTAYILDNSNENFLPVMQSDITRLASIGAEVIIIPCNTAHIFYDEIKKESPVPILNMVNESIKRVANEGAKKVGLLATNGTLISSVYQDAGKEFDLQVVLPSPLIQKKVMTIIYDNIKASKPVNALLWSEIDEFMKVSLCDRVILGCTELSVIKRELNLEDYYLDSLTVLAENAIVACGYELAY